MIIIQKLSGQRGNVHRTKKMQSTVSVMLTFPRTSASYYFCVHVSCIKRTERTEHSEGIDRDFMNITGPMHRLVKVRPCRIMRTVLATGWSPTDTSCGIVVSSLHNAAVWPNCERTDRHLETFTKKRGASEQWEQTKVTRKSEGNLRNEDRKTTWTRKGRC